MNTETFEDDNILQAEVVEDQKGGWSVSFVLVEGDQESYFTESELRGFLVEIAGDELNEHYAFMLERLESIRANLSDGNVHMAQAKVLADISRIKAALNEEAA